MANLNSKVVSELKSYIEEISKEDTSIKTSDLRSFLVVKRIKDPETQDLYLDSVGYKKGRTNFSTRFYSFLAEQKRTKEEARKFILDPSNSENTRNKVNHFLRIFELSEAIHSKYESDK